MVIKPNTINDFYSFKLLIQAGVSDFITILIVHSPDLEDGAITSHKSVFIKLIPHDKKKDIIIQI
ncbi:hypothetical protein GCM10011510_03020 [Streptococcus himalayensis]|uniref:Uncharacterized protein n=1 Tax=Streptococcus himalayensis TaxID=1888195 RepID=A0A917EEW7_9STRE|nr:hypothetical protein GCM10011510_03020 [Streptococcus himalayensis]